jgi:bleomycin hydrolase
MKKLLIVLTVFTASFIHGQETTTNKVGSSYEFKKVVHLDATPVQSQGYTGTCWSFSALSFFESEMIRKGTKNPEPLSQMYVARKAYEGKAEKYIRMDGKTNFSQGGAFHDIPWVIKRYGIVPQSVYDGLNYGSERHNHQELFAVLDGFMSGLLKHVNNSSSGVSKTWKTALNGILNAYFGEVPSSFTVEGKKYDAKSYAEATGLVMDDYVSITSFLHFNDYEKCQLAIQDNWAWGSSYNVPFNQFTDIVKKALKDGYTVAWGADVSEKGFNFREGLAIVPEDESTIKVKGRDNKNFSDAGAEKISNAFLTPVPEREISANDRQLAYDNKTTTDDHGMHITGMYELADGRTFFLVKNSWGTGNFPKGYLYVSEAYMQYKTINFYLHKDALGKDLQKKLKL